MYNIVLIFLPELVIHFNRQYNAIKFKEYLFVSVFVEGNIVLKFKESNASNVKPYLLEISTNQTIITIDKEKPKAIKVRILQKQKVQMVNNFLQGWTLDRENKNLG